MIRVPSSDGVLVALHDLGGSGPTMLVAHATGFHGHCYLPMAERLSDRFHVVAVDQRGHGETPHPDRPVAWQGFADDVAAAASQLADDGPIVAFGHSMGGASLLLTAAVSPELFSTVVVFEPISFPPDHTRPAPVPGGPPSLADGARRRRSSFPSMGAALENFASKAPLNVFHPAALDAYVRHGFAVDDDGVVTLKCKPEVEADTYLAGPDNGVWATLPSIRTRVVVVTGAVQPMQPSAMAAQIAELLPNGSLVTMPSLGHFGPMSHPDEVARVIDAAVCG